ncbi:MAG: hypothetical protein ACREIU_10505, partial [Planctomycetota bacterium]
VEWIDVEKYPNNGSGENARFQLVLDEAGGAVEFRYDGSTFSTGTDPWLATVGGESALAALGFDATGGGAANTAFPAADLLLAPVPATPTVFFSYTPIPAPPAFPGIVGTPGAVPLFGTPQLHAISPPAPIGFPFSFYGLPRSTFQVSEDGFLCFNLGMASGSPLNASNGVPGGSPFLPNDYVAPWWDDLASFAPTAATAYLVAGPPGSRTLTVEWRDLERAPGNGSGENARFAAVLREGSNLVEFHYDAASFATGVDAWDATVGLENVDGSRGMDATGSGVSNAAIPATDLVLDPCDCGFEFLFGTGCSTPPAIVLQIQSAGRSPSVPNPTYGISLA